MIKSDGITAQQPMGVNIPDHVSSNSRDARMVDAAHQFEASLMQELFAPLQKPGFSDDDTDASGSANALTSYASQAMARAVSARGGFGIANQIIAHLKKSAV